jgi:tetratricopeptide (TPR) repeat protein
MSSISQKQQNTANWLISRVTATPCDGPRLWNLAGAAGAGKSTVLKLVSEGLKLRGDSIPILATAPAGEVDAASVALLEMADQLQTANLMNGEMARISDPRRPWRDKIESFSAVIRRHSQEIVLLCDEPVYWYESRDSLLDDTPNNHARSLAEWLACGATCRRVISGRMPGGVEPLDATKAPRLDDGREFLDDPIPWGQSAVLAEGLRRSFAQSLDHYTVWQMKLLVALSRLKPVSDVARHASSGSTVTALLEEFLDLLERDRTASSICESLARLSLARVPVTRRVFDLLTAGTSADDGSLIEVCLCAQTGSQLGLHPLVRQEVLGRAHDPRRWETKNSWRLPAGEQQQVHQTLRDMHPEGATSVRLELESLRHEVFSGAWFLSPSDHRLRCVEQLHEIGRTLSYVHREHARAVEVFRLALQLDSRVAYSHHYLAFNLDWLAERPEEVEGHYREAIELQRGHPWWWSRWIAYLATRGRFREAREAWRDALDEFSLGGDESSRWLYLALHRWVARWLLHWSELDFAEDVLNAIPVEIAEAEASIQTLRDLLVALRAAEVGDTVFPLSVPANQWGSPVPHTDLPHCVDHRALLDWLPARIEHLDSETGRIFLLVGRRTNGAGVHFVYEDLELSQTDIENAAVGFRWSQLNEGRFLELGYYGEERMLRIGLHKNTTWWNAHLLPLVPPPNRWYERAVHQSWDQVRGD